MACPFTGHVLPRAMIDDECRIANELGSSWKLVRFLQTLTEISSFKPFGTKGSFMCDSWTWVEVG